MGIYLLALLLLVRFDSLQQTDEVLVRRIVMLVELVEALRQVRPQLRGVIPLQRRVVQAELMLAVVRKTGYLLFNSYLMRIPKPV